MVERMVAERVMVGGLMRCCTATLDRLRKNATERPAEGMVIPCDHCDSEMVWADGAWRWNQPQGLPDDPDAA